MRLQHAALLGVEADAGWTPPSPAPGRLHGFRLLLARLLWLVVAAYTLALVLAATPDRWLALTYPAVSAAQEALGVSSTLYAVYNLALGALAVSGSLVVAAVLFVRRSDEWQAILGSLFLITFEAFAYCDIHAYVNNRAGVTWLVVLLGVLSYASLALLLPHVRAERHRARWTRVPLVLVLVAQLLALGLPDSSPIAHASKPLAWLFLVVMLVLVAPAIVRQLFDDQPDSPDLRRLEARWIILGILGVVVAILFLNLETTVLPMVTPVYSLFVEPLSTIALLLIPVSFTVAVLRHRLWGLDLLINRALVYGALSATVVGLYVLVVGYLGTLFRLGNNLAFSLIATSLVALLFQPLRAWFQRGVNHMLYGWRDEPYTVLARLRQRLEATLTLEAVLPTITEAVANALMLPYVAIAIRRQNALVVAASYGTVVETPIHLPLTYQAEPVGELLLAARSRGDAFTASDRRLLTDLAHQAGIAIHAVRLTEELRELSDDLQRSRQRLVAAREEERRRLRRDLHDGLGPSLAGLVLKAGSARALYPRDPPAADALLLGVEADLVGVIGEIRRLVYNLRPPALDDLGLVAAIRACAAECAGDAASPAAPDGRALAISVETPDEALPSLPAAVEVAAYRIAQEALTNVVRHARARVCVVRVAAVGTTLRVEVSDDGVGIALERHTGVGLTSMRERAAELGGSCVAEASQLGGTCVLAHLPLSAGAV